MKRGKDDEKAMGPMFPRLHVNDTEKGGPRAPPRNKMALYEQLSIPSQRFKHGVVPINSNSSANGIPPVSSSQGNGQQMGAFCSHQLPLPGQATEKSASNYSDSSAPLMPVEQKKKLEEDDFRVPIFMQSNMGQDRGKTYSNMDRGKLFSSSPAYTEHSTKIVPVADNEPRQTVDIGPSVRQEGRSQNEENTRESMGGREQSIKSVSISSSLNKAEVGLRQPETYLRPESRNNSVDKCSRFSNADHNLLPDHRAETHSKSRIPGNNVFDEPTMGISNPNSSVSRFDFQAEEERIFDDTESCEDKTCRSLPTGIADRDDDSSETSMVDSISGLEISPDDVVGIIGQKHFWKARRAIVNQQRVFAVQVFELHRLIKVQRMIAGSPHLLLEDSAYLGKPIKGSAPKKLPIDYIVKAIPNVSKQKNDSEKPNHKIECSAENTVGKASLSSVQNGSHLPSHRPFSANSPATGDYSSGSWCFPQPQEHQWLIPMMSPSEGLVYKPYPGPGYMAPACGGCGPPGSSPMMGNFLNPAYGIPASHHYQAMGGVPPFAAPAGPQGYFPPYGMAVLSQGITGSAGEQMNHFAAPGPYGQSPRLGPNYDIQRQNSSNVPNQKSGAIPDAVQLHSSRESELQISTASSPSERVQGSGRGNAAERGDVLPLFPTTPVVEAPSGHIQQPREVSHSARVIKVVPHNGRLATESVARIFQSIQEERKQYDSA
ncbi:protein EARLY FLOWERING 3-like [Coffea arabica]|uniref:Protein EARLY FLOWERING 3-like n=1 Tax=Coffea arabica TaxID=13443 RepID=A0A6P6TSZ4_COFAR